MKAQSAIEFTILIAFMFIIFVTFFSIVGSKIIDIQKDNDRVVLEDMGEYLKSEIGLASTASNGYYREFLIPQTIGGRQYNVTINSYNGRNLNFTELGVYYINYSSTYNYYVRLSTIVNGTIRPMYNTTIVIWKKDNFVFVNTTPGTILE
jgi:hypothetical protein